MNLQIDNTNYKIIFNLFVDTKEKLCNIYICNLISGSYKQFIICITWKSLQKPYLVTPYAVGKEKRSVALVIPSEVVKLLKICPRSTFLLLKVSGHSSISLKIIREENLAKEIENMIPVINSSQATSQQASSIKRQ